MKDSFSLEQQALGEKPIEDAAAVAALHADNERVLRDHPQEAFLAEVTRRARLPQTRPRRLWPRLLWVPAPALAVALAIWVSRGSPAEMPDAAFKGGAQLVLTRGSDVLRDGDTVAAGDVVAIAVAPAGARHAVLVSVDGRGLVTLHLPSSPSASTEAPRASFSVGGFALDDAPGFERFVLLTSDAPIDVAAVMAAAARGSLDSLAGVDRQIVVLRK